MAMTMNPRKYLDEIYSGELDEGSEALMQFFATVYADLKGGYLLEFGGGPALYSLFSASKCCKAISFVDASEECLSEIKSWINRDTDSFDWGRFAAYALNCEGMDGNGNATAGVASREELLRRKLEYVGLCDAYSEDILKGAPHNLYDAIATNFCLDGIAGDRQTWLHLNERLLRHLAPGGLFVTTAVRRGQYWGTGGERHQAVSLTLADLRSMYEFFGISCDLAREIGLAGRDGYDGIIMMAGRQKAAS